MRDTRLLSLLAAAAVVSIIAAPATAGEADVIAVDVVAEGGGRYRFDVSVRHGDEGWDHYADAWDILGPDGIVLGTRVLLHPHESEQPFTRSLAGVAIPETVREVTIRARDKVHGFGGREITVTVPR
jgi:nucleotide-binding universal stress UspA family protein